MPHAPEPRCGRVHGTVVHRDIPPAHPSGLIRQLVHHKAVQLLLYHGVDKSLDGGPPAQDIAVIEHGPGVLFFEAFPEGHGEEGIIVDGIGLTEDIRSAVQELFEPVSWVLGVKGTVEAGVFPVQAAFEQLEDLPGPVCDLVAVAVFDGRAPDFRHLGGHPCAQGIALFAE